MTLPIEILRMRGTGGGGGGPSPALRIDDGVYTYDALHPNDAFVSLTAGNDGTLTASGDNFASYAWITDGTPADYEVRCTVNSGSMSIGTVGSWLPCSTTRVWGVERLSVGTKTVTLTLEIGLVGTSTALESGDLTLSATVYVE